MFHGRNTGKKAKALTIIKQAFEIIFLLTGRNPIGVYSQYSISLKQIEPSKTAVLVKTSPSSVPVVLLDNRLLMCHHSGESTR